MIVAKIELRVRRDSHVVILPNYTAGAANDAVGPDELRAVSMRPLEAIHVGNVLEDCELVDRVTSDRFNLPADVRWRVSEVKVEPAHQHRAERVYTLMRLFP